MIDYNFKYDLDHTLRSIEHKDILAKKKVLRNIYTRWYKVFQSYIDYQLKYVELGSGGGFIKEIIPDVITSDVNEIPGVDIFFSATEMPFDNNSLGGIFMIDAFHHFPNVEMFLSEAERVLKKKGKLIMIEPWNTLWSRFIYKNFHHELFDLKRDWYFPQTGPLSGSNMALPYIVFNRDIHIFNKKFPQLKLVNLDPHTPFSYVLSGGFSHKAFFPNFTFPFIYFIDRLSWVKNNFAMFVTIVIEKIND